MKYIGLLCLLILMSCKSSLTANSPAKKSNPKVKDQYYLTTQNTLLYNYPVLDIVDLREVVEDLNSLPIEIESFEKIYRSLNSYSEKYTFNRALLVTGDDCDVPIGYCYAYLIYKPKRD